MIREAISGIVEGRHLSEQEAAAVMGEIMSGEATSAQIGAFLLGLRLKGENIDELVGFAKVMREKVLRVNVPYPVVDTCGTGGDLSGTFNISTGAALVAAGAGIKVAKHGNRAFTSGCGSADCLEALGVKIDLGPEGVRACLDNSNMGFMFAPLYHPAMKHAALPRREIGIRTVFNLLGPMTNPAGARSQVLGVPEAGLTKGLAEVLERLDCRHALVVHGHDGLDELSIGAPSHICELKGGQVHHYEVDAASLGLTPAGWEVLKGGSVQDNARILREVLAGLPGPRREAVVLNAAAALVAADAADDLREGVALARESIDSGRARAALEALVKTSQSVAA
ncbi:MAG: anthranilate phosphoribosyltransferase [Chloroflexi bacterium]|nr:anthranilate phosphoribosyltransferase [Chloroflexota bacterium]